MEEERSPGALAMAYGDLEARMVTYCLPIFGVNEANVSWAKGAPLSFEPNRVPAL